MTPRELSGNIGAAYTALGFRGGVAVSFGKNTAFPHGSTVPQTLHEGDMRSFRLPKKYPLVIIPFRPMQHMYTMEDQLAALRTAAAAYPNR